MTAHYVRKLTQLPADVISLFDYERLAPEFMPHPVFEYIDGGAGDDRTRNTNTATFDRWQIVPRPLQSFAGAHTRCRWLDRTLPHPIGLAPVAYQKLVHPDGELASAQAAAVVGSQYIASTLSSVPLEDIARQVENPWFQLYWQGDREQSLALVRRAQAAGYGALVITVDVPVNGLRQRPQRAGFELPADVRAVNISDRHPPLTLAPGESVILHGAMATAPTWDDIGWLREQVSLPLLLKGILHPQDALRARELGIDGLVVSNHGGRALDGMPASISCLSAVREHVGGDMLLLLDSGVRRGTDVFRALALGANGVLLGRPVMYGLAVAGALGVAHSVKLLREELELTMALAGCPTLEAITRDHLVTA